ncbi:MAG: DUF2889 domain-containing protein [Pseudomonadota bacterium]
MLRHLVLKEFPLPLPPAQPRKHLHHRKVSYNGYLREDGLWDIEAQMTDTKAYDMVSPDKGDMPAGTPVHDMHIRVTVDDSMTIREIFAVMDSRPFSECVQAQDPMQKMLGVTMGPGWRHAIENALGSTRGCTHLRELLFNMATAAYQTIPVYQARLRDRAHMPARADGQPPFHLGKCMAWDFEGPVVLRHYPMYAGWQPKVKAKSASSE